MKSEVNKNVLDPDITDAERERIYQEFKRHHLRRLDKFVKSHKKKHRIENPDEYKSDDSCSSLFNEGEPRRMFGRLAKNKATGQSYKIPSFEEIRQIL